MSRRRGERTMEVRPPRRRSENPCTVDVAQKRSKQESMGKARAGKVPTGHRGRGGVPAGRLHADWPGLIPRGLLLKRLRPAQYAFTQARGYAHRLSLTSARRLCYSW